MNFWFAYIIDLFRVGNAGDRSKVHGYATGNGDSVALSKVLDCAFEISVLGLLSRLYFYFQTNYLKKGMDELLRQMG